MTFPRRDFIKSTLVTAAGLASPAFLAAQGAARGRRSPAGGPGIVDTNVSLFEWPYRRLKYGDNTRSLVAKLRRHGITQAWAGSYEALFHRNINAVNQRLAEECRTAGDGLLVPFGALNPAWSDWEEDLRRCHEVHRMPGIRVYPGYQYFSCAAPEFRQLLEAAGRRGLIVQIVGDMEDSRVHHPSFVEMPLDVGALIEALKAAPQTKVQLVHATNKVSGANRTRVVRETKAVFDISRFEGNGILAQVLGVDQPLGTVAEGGVPAERLLFGSHAPYFPVETSVFRLFESPLSLAQMTAIMEGNARHLLPAAGKA